MSYTFGGATGDDMTFAAGGASLGGNLNRGIICGWYYPTTLTNGRGYWSAAQTYGMYVDATTANFRFKTQNATTVGEWTAPGGVAVNRWWFVGVMNSTWNTGPACAWRVWVGDDSMGGLTEITVTNAVAPVGNGTGQTTRTAGNIGTGTVAFQGQVGWVSYIAVNGTASNGGCIPNDAAGTITNDEAGFSLNRWIRPLYYGQNPNQSQLSPTDLSSQVSILHFPMLITGCYYANAESNAPPFLGTPTINGATYSANHPPTAPPANWPQMNPMVRRAA